MKRDVAFVVLVAGLLACSITTAQAEAWPCWRGPRGDGTCVEKNIPTKWDPADVHWKTELPAKGMRHHSRPHFYRRPAA